MTSTGLFRYSKMKVMHLCIPRRRRKECLFSVGLCVGSSTLLYPAHGVYSGILNNTRTTLGRSLLRTWLLRPSLSLATIRFRHNAVECFTLADNFVTASATQLHLKGMKNIPHIMSQMRSGRSTLTDWQGLVKVTLSRSIPLQVCLCESVHLSRNHGSRLLGRATQGSQCGCCEKSASSSSRRLWSPDSYICPLVDSNAGYVCI